ncbi:hypothetical protein AURANDRAFT_71001, partial [Aureococcus anophagefferens]
GDHGRGAHGRPRRRERRLDHRVPRFERVPRDGLRHAPRGRVHGRRPPAPGLPRALQPRRHAADARGEIGPHGGGDDAVGPGRGPGVAHARDGPEPSAGRVPLRPRAGQEKGDSSSLQHEPRGSGRVLPPARRVDHAAQQPGPLRRVHGRAHAGRALPRHPRARGRGSGEPGPGPGQHARAVGRVAGEPERAGLPRVAGREPLRARLPGPLLPGRGREAAQRGQRGRAQRDSGLPLRGAPRRRLRGVHRLDAARPRGAAAAPGRHARARGPRPRGARAAGGRRRRRPPPRARLPHVGAGPRRRVADVAPGAAAGAPRAAAGRARRAAPQGARARGRGGPLHDRALPPRRLLPALGLPVHGHGRLPRGGGGAPGDADGGREGAAEVPAAQGLHAGPPQEPRPHGPGFGGDAGGPGALPGRPRLRAGDERGPGAGARGADAGQRRAPRGLRPAAGGPRAHGARRRRAPRLVERRHVARRGQVRALRRAPGRAAALGARRAREPPAPRHAPHVVGAASRRRRRAAPRQRPRHHAGAAAPRAARRRRRPRRGVGPVRRRLRVRRRRGRARRAAPAARGARRARGDPGGRAREPLLEPRQPRRAPRRAAGAAVAQGARRRAPRRRKRRRRGAGPAARPRGPRRGAARGARRGPRRGLRRGGAGPRVPRLRRQVPRVAAAPGARRDPRGPRLRPPHAPPHLLRPRPRPRPPRRAEQGAGLSVGVERRRLEKRQCEAEDRLPRATRGEACGK